MIGKISVVIPVYNEESTISELCERLEQVLSNLNEDYEVIFIDDGSKDRTTEALRLMSHKNKRIKVIFLSRNFGQHISIAAGLSHATGEILILMDADLQDIPEEIPKLLSKFSEGYDIVYGMRTNRADSFLKKINAELFFLFFEKLTGYKLPQGISTFRVMSRRFVDAFNMMPEHSRFTAGIMAWIGFPYTTVPIEHSDRKTGKSKYSFLKLFKLSLDAIFSFSDYPLKLASNVGLFLSFSSIVIGLYMILRKLTTGFIITGYASLIVSLFFLAGLQFFFMGIIGEYIARIFKDVQKRPLYIIKDKLNFD